MLKEKSSFIEEGDDGELRRGSSDSATFLRAYEEAIQEFEKGTLIEDSETSRPDSSFWESRMPTPLSTSLLAASISCGIAEREVGTPLFGKFRPWASELQRPSSRDNVETMPAP